MVFGDRAGAPDQHNPLHPLMTSGNGGARAVRHLGEAGADVDAASAAEAEIE